MSTTLMFVAALWLLTALIHGLLGTRKILQPVLASAVGDTSKHTSEVAWHILTWHFLLLSGAAVAATFVAIFTLRGVLGFFEVALRPAIRNTPYMKWSRAYYSPLSLLLALLIAVGAQS